MPKKLASVMRRVPGNSKWAMVDYPLTRGAFDFRILQAMAGGDCLYQAIRLDAEYCLICDEEGRIKPLPICVSLRLVNGTDFPVFGPVAVVREQWTKKLGGSTEYIGLNDGDRDIVLAKFPWVTM